MTNDIDCAARYPADTRLQCQRPPGHNGPHVCMNPHNQVWLEWANTDERKPPDLGVQASDSVGVKGGLV